MRTLRHFALFGVVATLSAGCNAFNVQEAQEIAKASTLLGIIAFGELTDELAAAERRGTEADMNFVPLEDGFTFDGSLSSDGPTWTGDMVFDGSLTGDLNSAEWTFTTDFDQCASGATTLDGGMDWRWEAELLANGAHFEWEMIGEIAATGEVEGTGEMDYLAIVDIDGNSVSYDVLGSIGGAPVDFSLTLTVPVR